MDAKGLLVSDIDGTLLGDDAALAAFRRWFDEQSLAIVYASGRFTASINQSIAQSLLPRPLATIGGVGTEIHWFPSGERLNAWPACAAAGWNESIVRHIASRFAGIEPQPEEFQSPWKASFFWRKVGAAQLHELETQLRAAGIAANIIYSSQRDLDILPAGVDKGSAAQFLARELGFHERQVFASGDSGNDLALLTRGFRSIVVQNAQPELKSLAHPQVYHAQRPMAAGVLEGLQFWLAQDAT